MTDTPPRLYLVLPPEGPTPAEAVPALKAALETRTIACVRLDLGAAEEAAWREAVNLFLPPCHAADVPLVVTDRDDLVEPLGLDGVHLAQSGAKVRALRKRLGTDRIIGADGGAERHRGMSLAEAGADYIALGPAPLAGAELYQWWSEMIETPVVAEGGVDLATAQAIAPFVDFLVPDPALVWADPKAALPPFAALFDEA
ncbi:MAG: thiamine phosphate synthase [Pseudomonadota bacterium]